MKSKSSTHTSRISLAGCCVISMALLTTAILLVRPPCVNAQNTTFSSGSDGSDGAYAPTTSGYFDPVALGLHGTQDQLCVFNFTTITIPKGVTITLSASKLNCPIYWLASGTVDIEGVLSLRGNDGVPETTEASLRIPATPGSGGYAGGVGGNSTQPAQAGNGPGGSPAGYTNGTGSGNFTGDNYLIPLVGGSGGGGAPACSTGNFGPGGGAGGGAILIASSTQITLNGLIFANGGNNGSSSCGDLACGSGGAIRLVSNTITGAGGAQANACGGNGGPAGSYGLVRLEGNAITFSGSFNGTPSVESNPLELLLPAVPPQAVLVTSVGGTAINENPFSFPDITINTASPVSVVITAHQVPVGTVPTLYIFSEKADQVIPCTGGLQGTITTSTCTVSIAYPYGGSRGFVKATWSQ